MQISRTMKFAIGLAMLISSAFTATAKPESFIRKSSSVVELNEQEFKPVSFGSRKLQDTFSWTQLGDDIDGEAWGDSIGRSVSLSADGNRLAIGAPNNDDNGDSSGHVRVYNYTPDSPVSTWTQLGDDIDGEAAGDYSGLAVSLSADGNRLAIGAHLNDGNGNASGHVRVYNYTPDSPVSTWTQLGDDIDGEASDFSGSSVSLSADGNRVAIGTPHAAERVYNYTPDSPVSTWTQLGDDINREIEGNWYAASVSLSADGNRLAIGATNHDDSSRGHVCVYNYTPDSPVSTWTQLGDDIDGEAARDLFGWSVSLSADGNRLAIGATLSDGNGRDSGRVRVYNYTPDSPVSTWTQLGDNIDGEAVADSFGWSVSLSADGNRLAIGATNNDGNGSNSGHVRVYNYTPDSPVSTWTQLGDDIDGEAAEDNFGYSVSLSADGNRLAIGAANNDGNGLSSGHVRVYTVSGLPSAIPVASPTVAPVVDTYTESPIALSPVAPAPIGDTACELEYILYNADEDKPLHILEETECVELFQFSIQVQPKGNCSPVHSAHMELSGPRDFVKTENKAPFFIFGNRNGDIKGRGYIAGDYSITSSLYSEREAGGDLLAQREFSFTMTKDC